MPELLGAWLLTWWVHGTLLMLGAWIATRLWRRMPVAWAEGLWRTALLGAAVTASVQLALDVEPAGGRVAMARDVPPAVAPLPPEPEPLMPAPEVVTVPFGPQPEPIALPQPHVPASSSAAAPASPGRPVMAWLGVAWALGLLVLAARHGAARRHLRRRLCGRRPLEAGPLAERLAALASQAGVRAPRLSVARDLGSPLAVGLRRPEIVVPARALDDLTPAQQEAMLAHELAHHVRRDALWQGIVRAYTTLLFFQPLHVLARRRLHESAEFLCDAWAVDQTGCSRSLAECLAEVAGWVAGVPRREPVPAMAAHGSMLVRRVRRLVDHDLPPAAPRARWVGCLVAVLPLIVVVFAAPTVAARAAGEDPMPSLPAAVAPSAHAGEAPREDASALDAEIAALEAEVGTLLDLLTRVEEPPAALRAGADRLARRLEALKSRRVALTAAPEEMPR